MIPSDILSTINEVREAYIDSVTSLREIPSFSTLIQTSGDISTDFERLAEILRKRLVRDACQGDITCAFIGSSGHGKTTILDEMFPNLAARGWLETDVTDTTSQALCVRHAPPGDSGANEVAVTSWSIEQIKHLMNHPEVRDQNERDNIAVSYLEDAVIVDGTDAALDAQDLAEWRYPRRVELEPFSQVYRVPADRGADRKFIRALTVKEQSAVLDNGAVLDHAGRSYNALQLRALVKSVSLRDGYDRLLGWARQDGDQLQKVSFVDTPGLAVSSVVKDEVLRHFLGKKSNQIALELLRNDELDIVIHLVLCGQKSQFDVLWNEIEREYGPAEMEGIAERLILAVNGMNIYFTNPDIRAKYTDEATAAREGDHFAATLEDNILQRMSPRGQIRPARIVFLDSKNIVDAFGNYTEFYERHRKTMEAWSEPGGTGHDTLARIGCLESFRENIDALTDPEDRGQGYLVRQLLEVVQEKGAGILLRKHLVRTGLLGAIDGLHDLLGRFYDTRGQLNTAAAHEALAQCLAFLDRKDPMSIERFANKEIDPFIDGLVPDDDDDAREAWVSVSFRRMADIVKEAIIDTNQDRVPRSIWNEFERFYNERVEIWGQRWGYHDTDFPPPPDSAIGTRDLLMHCLRIHGREILFQLMTNEVPADGRSGFSQTDGDRDAIAAILRSLEAAKTAGSSACTTHGVTA